MFLGAVKLVEDPPAAAPKAGGFSGVLRPPGKAATLKAVCRATGKSYQPGAFDPASGKFSFKDLPGDASYDLCLRTAEGRELQGICLDFVDDRMLRLAEARRTELGLPPERQHLFDHLDVRELLKWVADMKDFMDIRRVLYLRGHGRRATMLVELLRAREFYDRKGDELIWRTELWYFENEFGGWDRLPNQEIVLERRRIPEPQWRQIDLEYYPELSVHISAGGEATPVDFEIPAKPDLSRGRVPNTPIGLDSVPHLSGVPTEPSTMPTTQPAAP